MTDDAEPRTPLDDAIDEVARALTRGPAPDLRSRVAERLETRASGVAWWQPALATALIIAAVLLLWPARDASPPRSAEERPAPTVPARVPAPTEPPRVAAATSPAPSRPMLRRSRASRLTETTWPELTRALPPIEVEPIVIDGLAREATASIDAVDLPGLAVEPLDVEPLPRSYR
jgi:hypothetical protein